MAWKLWPRPQPPAQLAEEPAQRYYHDPLNDDPSNLPALVGPQVFYSSLAANFMPAVRDPNIIASTGELGVTMNVQPVIDYTAVVGTNVAVGAPNIATGAPPGVRMSTVLRAFEEQLVAIQNMLLGAP